MATVTHEIDGKVGVVSLAKPPHNLMDDALIEDLVAAYRAVVAGGCRAYLEAQISAINEPGRADEGHSSSSR